MLQSATNVIDLPVPAIPVPVVEDKFNAGTVRQFIEATEKVAGNFQQFITDCIEQNRTGCIIDYAHEILEEHGGAAIVGTKEAKPVNDKLAILRVPLRRACKKMGINNHSVKWDSKAGKYVFVESVKQGQQQGQQEGQQEGQPDDSQHAEASRLMAQFMANRTVDNAAKVTEFMMGLVK